MLAGALGFLGRFAVNVPYAEDGMLIPYVTGDEPLTMDFLWCQYSNHIIPLPKLVLILLARLTHDFRTSMYVSVLACAAVALALTFAAKSLRGRFDYPDAFFSIGLLHLGHWESFLLGFAIQEVMSTALLAIILLVILRGRTSPHSQAILNRGIVPCTTAQHRHGGVSCGSSPGRLAGLQCLVELARNQSWRLFYRNLPNGSCYCRPWLSDALLF